MLRAIIVFYDSIIKHQTEVHVNMQCYSKQTLVLPVWINQHIDKRKRIICQD